MISCGKLCTSFEPKRYTDSKGLRCRKNQLLGISFRAKQFTVCKRHFWGVTGGYNIESVYHIGHYKLKLLN